MATPYKILFILGTRPEAIKLAPVIKEAERDASFEVETCVTAQHREMLDQTLEVFTISPEHDLDLMQNDQSLFTLTSTAVVGLGDVLGRVKPDFVIVQGDTTTTMVAALAAYYLRIPVGHVEAGLRTFQRYAPFPEEMNRRIVSVVADLHFAPTEWARRNLLREGVGADRIFVVGNTVVDAVLEVAERLDRQGDADLDLGLGRLILVTVHRRESFGQLGDICQVIRTIVEEFSDVVVICPVHLNPNVQKVVRSGLAGIERVRLVPPLDYLSLVRTLRRSYLVLTDSGGIQEEAPVFGKPVLVLREVSERPEGIEANVARLVGTSEATILPQVRKLLRDEQEYAQMARAQSPYGDGKASGRILEQVKRFLGSRA